MSFKLMELHWNINNMQKKRLGLLSHVYIGVWVRKPFLWATHTSSSMERGLYKAVLFPLPTHSEGFLCFHCFFTPPHPIHSPFFFLFLLLLRPASFFGLFEGSSWAWTPTSQHTNRISPKRACRWRNTPSHQPWPGTRGISKHILSPSASGSEVNGRVGSPWLSIQPTSAVTHTPLVLLYWH